MLKVKIKLKKKIDDSHPVYIEKGLAKKIPQILKRDKIGKKYAIITDSTVQKLFGQSLQRYLKKNGITCQLFAFPQGEKSKTLDTVKKLSQKMVSNGFDRHDAIIAIGGGVVGDIAGFLAAIYMRGIPYIHIPTTLLAMVDSSIGGKTGVDLEKCGKNLLGTITQPHAVYMDIDYLMKLPEKQIRSGLGEVIKYGAIYDKRFFRYLEQNLDKIYARDEKTLGYIIKKSVKIKGKVVQADEKEAGHRMILNYGHTYGHAIEKLSNYTLLHGYAISIGMVIANKMAVKRGLMTKEDAERIKKIFKDAGLPVTTTKKPKAKDLLSDKKKDGNKINFVFVTKIGKAVIRKIPCPAK